MIVLIVQQIGLSVSELKRQLPVAIDSNRPTAPFGAFERMQLGSWNIDIANDLRRLQGNQQHPQSFRMLRLDASKIAGLIKAAQPLVPNRLDHTRSVACCASRNKRPNVRVERAARGALA